MVRKKNKMFVDSADRTPHYSLRKLSVGVASVLLSTTLWMGANGSVAHADTINDTTATVAGKASRSADTESKQELAAPSQKTAPQAQVPASAEKQAAGQTLEASNANTDNVKQASAAATEGKTNGSAGADAANNATKNNSAYPEANSSGGATEDDKNESTTLDVSQAFKTSTVAAVNKKMARARVMATAPAGGKNTAYDNQNQAIVEGQDQISYKNGYLASLANQAEQDGLNVNKEKVDKTYAVKQDALDDLDNQASYIQSEVTKYKAEKAAYDAAENVYNEDLKNWIAAQSSTDPHMVKGISQGLSFTNETDASLDVTSGSDKPVHFIKSSAWLGSDGQGVYTDGMTNGGNISKSFINSDISDSQAKGTALDGKHWGKTYTGVQLNKHESVVASYTGLKNSVYIDKDGVAHKLGKVQVKYTLNETTAKDGTANIFLSNNPNIALWYGAAGDGVARDQSSGRVDLTVDLTFYDENGNPITLGQGSNAWLDMSSLNNGTTKVEYFAPDGNTTMQIPGSTIQSHTNGDWHADSNNEDSKVNPTGWDNPASADRYYGAAIMELEGHSFHIGQEITKYNPRLTNSRNVYSWFALDSSLATAYKPVKPTEPEPPTIVWHGVTYEPQKATVTYIDDTTNTTLRSDSLEGDSKADSKYNTKSSIQDYESKGYEFVSDSTNGQDVVFDTDSNNDQSYFVHLKHGTEPNQDTTTVKETIHYNYADGSKAAEDHSDSVTLSRTGTKDKVTGNTAWNAWSTGQISSVTSPTIPGYTADKKEIDAKSVNGPHDEFVETVTYKADTQKATVTYIDDTTNTTLRSDSLEGDSKADSKYNTKSSIQDYESKGYEFVSDSTNGQDVVFDTDSNNDQSYFVHLKHGTEPNQDTTTVKETIHYNYADGSKAAEDHSDSVTLSRTGTKDKVTGNTAWNAWSTGQISSVTSPTIPGYTADKKEIDAKSVNGPHDEFVETVTYKADTQKATVTYIDDTTNTTLRSDSLEGDSKADSKYNTKSSIQDYESKGYEFVSDSTNGQDVVFDTDSNNDQSYFVHLKHGTEPNQDTTTVKETIHYNYADGSKAAEDHSDSVTLSRTGTKDKVTGNTAWNAWSTGQISSVTSPTIPGYTADKKEIDAKSVNGPHDEFVETVTYKADTQKATVTYIDDTTNTTLRSDSLEGDSKADSKYNTKSSIQDYESKGYEFVSDSTNGQDVVFDTDSNNDQSYFVHLKHGTEPNQDTTTVKETIHYNYADGSKAAEDHSDSVTLSRTGTKDKVTGNTAWNAWSTGQISSVTSPTIPGYTADKKEIDAKSVNGPHDEFVETVTYKADTQKATVTYIDDTTNTTLRSDSLEGDSKADSKYNTKSSIQDYESKGYEFVSDSTNGQDVVFDTDSNNDQSYFVHLKHGTEPNQDTTTVKETIHYNYADGSKAAEDHSDSVTLSRTGTKDKVTGNTAWNAWSTGQISSVTSPTIPGYTADKKEIDAKSVNGPHDEFVETVTYKADTQKATVTYIDDTTNTTLRSDSLEGDSKADSKYNTKSSIQDYESKGYEFVSDSTNGQDVVFDTDSNNDQSYFVHLKHGTVTVTPDDKTPVKPGDKINPNDPNSPEYQDDVKHDNLAKDAKQTVHYEGAGTDTPADSVTTRKDAFKRTVTYDKVTGKSTTSSWSEPNTTFDKVDTPVVKGYTANKKQAGGLTATPDHPEVSDTVVYTPNGSVVPVDPDGNPIPNTPSVPYETDPKDPTKVVDGKVPEVPSWTPKKGKPGDPVKPSDPTKDTKVPYDHTITPGETTVSGKQTVTYVYKDKDGKVVKTKTVEQDTTFTGTTTTDEVTGETTTTWDPKDHKYTEVTTPVEPGYTADKKSVGGETVTPDDPNRSYTVVYTPNGSIVPVDPNGNPIPNTPSVPYETDPKDPTKVVDGKVPEVPSWTPKKGKPGAPVKPSDPTKDTKVPYDHTITPGETTVSGKQTVTYVYKDKDGKVVKTKTVEQDTTFTGTTTTDEVTGETTTTWDPKDHKYTEVTTPVEPGYTADKKSVGGETVTPDNPNRSYTVVYTPNGSIVPVDSNGNPIPGTNPVPYETDPNDPTKVVDGKVPEVPSWTPKNGKPGDPVKPSDPTKDTKVPYDHTITPGKTTTTGKEEGLPEKPAKSAKAPAEKLVKTPVKAPKAVKEASPAEMPAQKAAQAQDQLPQTGEDNSKAAFGLGLASILGGIGILGAFKRKKKEN